MKIKQQKNDNKNSKQLLQEQWNKKEKMNLQMHHKFFD